jgi:hypothetical protein
MNHMIKRTPYGRIFNLDAAKELWLVPVQGSTFVTLITSQDSKTGLENTLTAESENLALEAKFLDSEKAVRFPKITIFEAFELSKKLGTSFFSGYEIKATGEWTPEFQAPSSNDYSEESWHSIKTFVSFQQKTKKESRPTFDIRFFLSGEAYRKAEGIISAKLHSIHQKNRAIERDKWNSRWINRILNRRVDKPHVTRISPPSHEAIVNMIRTENIEDSSVLLKGVELYKATEMLNIIQLYTHILNPLLSRDETTRILEATDKAWNEDENKAKFIEKHFDRLEGKPKKVNPPAKGKGRENNMRLIGENIKHMN